MSIKIPKVRDVVQVNIHSFYMVTYDDNTIERYHPVMAAAKLKPGMSMAEVHKLVGPALDDADNWKYAKFPIKQTKDIITSALQLLVKNKKFVNFSDLEIEARGGDKTLSVSFHCVLPGFGQKGTKFNDVKYIEVELMLFTKAFMRDRLSIDDAANIPETIKTDDYILLRIAYILLLVCVAPYSEYITDLNSLLDGIATINGHHTITID